MMYLVNQPPFAISYPPQPILGLPTAKQSTIIPDDCMSAFILLKLILPVAETIDLREV